MINTCTSKMKVNSNASIYDSKLEITITIKMFDNKMIELNIIPKADCRCSLHLVGIITKRYAIVVQYIGGIVE